MLAHGLLRASFIPPQPQRDLRDLTRQRTVIIQERAAVINRLQKVLEWANLKLSSLVSDSDNAALAELAQGRMRAKREALEQALSGRVREHHRFMIARHLEHIDFLDEQVATFDAQITALLAPSEPSPPSAPRSEGQAEGGADTGEMKQGASLSWAEAVEIWDEIPGIGRRVAEQLVAEVGVDMSQFRSAAHLASWAKLCPGNNESAGKRKSASIGKGNNWLRATLVQAAHSALRTKGTWIAAYYGRLAARRGKKRAIVAVAHKLLVLAYTLIRKGERYRERGANYLDERQQDKLLNRLRARIERLGYTVNLEPRAVAAD